MKDKVTVIGTVQGKYDTDTNNDIIRNDDNDDTSRNNNNNKNNNIPILIDKYMNEQQQQQSISFMNGNIKMNQYYHYNNNNNSILYFHLIFYRIGTIIIFLCSIFLYLYLLFSKTILSSIYDTIIQYIKSNILIYLIKNPQYIKDKAIVPLITFIVPILLIGTVASLFHIYHYNTNNITNIYKIIYQNNNNNNNNQRYDYSNSYYTTWKRRILSFIPIRGNCRQWDVLLLLVVRYSYVFIMIYIPFLVYTISSIILKIPKTDITITNNNNNNTNHDDSIVVPVDVISFYKNNVIVSDIANVFGIVGLYSMSLILIPITKYNYIFQYFFTSIQNPIVINQYIHQTIGYCIILTVLLHVILHIYRWYCIQNENIIYMLFVIPLSCFKSNNSNITKEMMLCLNSTTYDTTPIDCTCYGHVRNVMGTIGTIAIIILSITSSISYIRRYYYKLFYILHVLCSILFFICIILHWNRSIIYLSIGILYYISGTFPLWIEQSILYKQQKQSQSQLQPTSTIVNNNNSISNIISTLPLTKQVLYNTTQYQHTNNSIIITNIEQIGSSSSGSSSNNNNHNSMIVAVSFAVSYDTIQQYHSGQYIKLYVPSICQYVSHPFTVNQIISNNNSKNNNNSNNHNGKPECNDVLQLRITFRCIGSFTKQLANELLLVKKNREEQQDEDEQNEQQQSRILLAPAIYIDGLYGIHNRLQQTLFDHDHVIFIAGGIGITPYLSLLYNIISFNVTNNQNNMNDCIFLLKRITFIWICRDKSLIAYIKREYLNPIIQLYNDHSDIHHIQLQIQIYHTYGISSSNNITSSIDQHYKNRSGSKNGSPIIIPKNVSYTNLEQQQHQIENDDIEIDPMQQQQQQHSGYYGGNRPFTLSVFFPRNTNLSYINNGNTISFIFFISITWIGLYIIWYCYTRFQSSDTILSRLIAPISIVLYGYIISRLLYWLIVECNLFNRFNWKNCCISKNKFYRKDSNHIVLNDMIQDDDENIDINQIKNQIASSSSSGWIPIETQDDDEFENNRYCTNTTRDMNHSPDLSSTNASSPKLYKSSLLELGIVHCNSYHDTLHDQINSNSTIPTINNNNTNNNTNITIEMLYGRPNIPDVLHHLFHTTTTNNINNYDNSNNENQYVGLYVCGPQSLIGTIRDTIYCSTTKSCNKGQGNSCCCSSIVTNDKQCHDGCCTYYRHHDISLYEESFEI